MRQVGSATSWILAAGCETRTVSFSERGDSFAASSPLVNHTATGPTSQEILLVRASGSKRRFLICSWKAVTTCDAARKTEDLIRGFCDDHGCRPHVGMPAVVRLRVQLADESFAQMDVHRHMVTEDQGVRTDIARQKAIILLKRSFTRSAASVAVGRRWVPSSSVPSEAFPPGRPEARTS